MKINRTQLSKTLRESVVSPNARGPIKIMLETGDPRYLIQRATELCRLATSSPTPNQQVSYLETAITILAAAKFELKKNCVDEVKTTVFSSGEHTARQDV